MNSDDRHESKWSIAAYLIRERRLGWGMVTGGLVWALLAVGQVRIPCPVMELTGHPCPGCGLTRSTFAMFRGDWSSMLHLHPFAPIFIIFWAAVGMGLLMPIGPRMGYVAKLDQFERLTRWPLWVGTTLVAYSLTRWLCFC